MSRLLRFEIHASQPQRLIDFYTAVLGWSFSRVEPDGWWKIHTDPLGTSDISAGLVQRPGAAPGNAPVLSAFICTFAVDSLDATLARALDLGAEPALPKLAVPRVGWLAYIKDPEGNVLGLMQLDPGAG
jgi:predicted enzyme related to lactoylglutathione lyase